MFVLIGNKASIFVCSDMIYNKSSCSGHSTVIINIGQHFKFDASNLSPKAHFSKRSENPPWHNGHSRTDIAEFGPIPIQFLLTMAQTYCKVVIMNQKSIVIGQKPVRSSITALPVSRALVELGFLNRIGCNEFEVAPCLRALDHDRCTKASDISYLQRQIY